MIFSVDGNGKEVEKEKRRKRKKETGEKETGAMRLASMLKRGKELLILGSSTAGEDRGSESRRCGGCKRAASARDRAVTCLIYRV